MQSMLNQCLHEAWPRGRLRGLSCGSNTPAPRQSFGYRLMAVGVLAGPTTEDVTASIDEAQDQALKASESNRYAVEMAASDVKESLKKEK